MSSERRVSVADLVNTTEEDYNYSHLKYNAKKAAQTDREHGSQWRGRLKIETPNTCRDILGCQDSHEKGAHKVVSLGPREPRVAESSMNKEHGQYMASWNPDGLQKLPSLPRHSDGGASGHEPVSCNSSGNRDSFSVFFHTCQTGPNALPSSSSNFRPSSSCQSSHQNSLGNFSLNQEHVVSPIRNSWEATFQIRQNSDLIGSVVPPGPLAKPSCDENAAMTLSMMREPRQFGSDSKRARPASYGFDSDSPSEPRSQSAKSGQYQGERLPSIHQAIKYQHNLPSQQIRLQYEQPHLVHPNQMFRDPFETRPAETSTRTSSFNASTSSSYINEPSGVHGRDYYSTNYSYTMRSDKRCRDEDDDGQDLQGAISPTTVRPRRQLRSKGRRQYGPVAAPVRQTTKNSRVHKGKRSQTPDSFTSPSAKLPASRLAKPKTINAEASSPFVLQQSDSQAGPGQTPETQAAAPVRTDRSFLCAFMGAACNTPGDNSRKGISDFFGRNKDCTAAIPRGLWMNFCRQHYQRLKYRYSQIGQYGSIKCQHIEEQIKVFERNLGQDTYGYPIVWLIGFQKSLTERVRDEHSRVSRGQEPPPITESNPKKKDELEKKRKELEVALVMEDDIGMNKTSADCIEFLHKMAQEVRRVSGEYGELIKCEFLPVIWGNVVRTKSQKID